MLRVFEWHFEHSATYKFNKIKYNTCRNRQKELGAYGRAVPLTQPFLTCSWHSPYPSGSSAGAGSRHGQRAGTAFPFLKRGKVRRENTFSVVYRNKKKRGKSQLMKTCMGNYASWDPGFLICSAPLATKIKPNPIQQLEEKKKLNTLGEISSSTEIRKPTLEESTGNRQQQQWH